jgi:hypothetical protein
MKNLLVRSKHIDLDHALTVLSDPNIPTRDAVVMWRKALRRVDGPTKELLSRVAKLHSKKRTPGFMPRARLLAPTAPLSFATSGCSVWSGSVADVTATHRHIPLSANSGHLGP